MSTNEPSPIACLVIEFPGWDIRLTPNTAMCSAYWQSEDGRSRPYIVADTPAELLERLRAIRGEASKTSSRVGGSRPAS
jgi:hypothetical protein